MCEGVCTFGKCFNEYIISPNIRRICSLECDNSNLLDDFHHHCIEIVLNSKSTINAYEKGYFDKYFRTLCRNEYRNKSSRWNKLFRNPKEPITYEPSPFNLSSQRLERYLHEYTDEDDKYIKKIVQVYLLEGSEPKAAKAIGVSIATINRSIQYVISNFPHNSNGAFDFPQVQD